MLKILTPQALPGSCFMCGSGKRDWYVDTEQSFEFYGAAIICNVCIEALSHIAEWISPDTYKEMSRALEEAEHDVFEYTKRNQALENAIDGLKKAGYSYIDDSTVVRRSGYVVPSDETTRAVNIDERTKVGSGEGETPEPTDDEGMDFLRSDGAVSESELDFNL